MLQVLDEPGREAESRSYVWVYRGGEPELPSLIYQYFTPRSGDVPFEFFDGHECYVQTDGYDGYDTLGREPGILMLGIRSMCGASSSMRPR